MFLWVDYNQHLLRKLLDNKHQLFFTLFCSVSKRHWFTDVTYIYFCSKYRSGKLSCWYFWIQKQAISHFCFLGGTFQQHSLILYFNIICFIFYSLISFYNGKNKTKPSKLWLRWWLNSKFSVSVDLLCTCLDLILYPLCQINEL